MEPFEASLLTYMQQHGLVAASERVAVAISGGADSVALTLALAALTDTLSFSLLLLHQNYGFRFAEADADETFVRELAQKLQIPLWVDRLDGWHQLAAEAGSLQDSARRWRYDWFDRLLQREVFDKVALAHHRDDQAETVLLRLLRGAGVRGLSGMRPIRSRYLIRPMLNQSKAEVLQYLKRRGSTYQQDSSNEKHTYLRNRIRLEILPMLRKENPKIVATLAQTATRLQAEYDVLEQDVERLLAMATLLPDEVMVGYTDYLSFLVATRWRFWRRLCEEKGLAYHGLLLDRLDAAISSKSSGRYTLSTWWQVRWDATKLHFERVADPLFFPRSHKQVLQANITRFWGFTFAVQDLKFTPSRLVYPLQPNLHYALRTWRRGDRIRTSVGTQKVQDLFTNAHVPKAKRHVWPILVSAETDEVLWLVGLHEPIGDGALRLVTTPPSHVWHELSAIRTCAKMRRSIECL